MLARDAFLYMEPRANAYKPAAFAACESCRDWNGVNCRILGPLFPVVAGDSCGLYVNGAPAMNPLKSRPRVTPTEAGFVRRPVRCENCAYYAPADGERGQCTLFAHLNAMQPGLFELDANVRRLGCCNAQTPK